MELKKEIKGVRMDLIQLGVTAVGVVGLMESGVKFFYSLLIGAVMAAVIRHIYDSRDRRAAKYREELQSEHREKRSKSNK